MRAGDGQPTAVAMSPPKRCRYVSQCAALTEPRRRILARERGENTARNPSASACAVCMLGLLRGSAQRSKSARVKRLQNRKKEFQSSCCLGRGYSDALDKGGVITSCAITASAPSWQLLVQSAGWSAAATRRSPIIPSHQPVARRTQTHDMHTHTTYTHMRQGRRSKSHAYAPRLITVHHTCTRWGQHSRCVLDAPGAVTLAQSARTA